MSMLGRYRKTGGFEQLVYLIETCTTAKRESLMKMIEAEDPSWAALIRTKALTIERIFSWEALDISEVTHNLPPRTLAILLTSLGPEALLKATHTETHLRRREIESLVKELNPTAGEVEAARVKLIHTVREMEKDRRLNLERIDPSLSLRDIQVA